MTSGKKSKKLRKITKSIIPQGVKHGIRMYNETIDGNVVSTGFREMQQLIKKQYKNLKKG